MGYQESLIKVNSLAEVAGIAKAIEESEEVNTLEYLSCCCAARAKRDIYRGSWLGRSLSDVGEDESPIDTAGSLFAVLAGARLYQPFFWIDCVAGINEQGYSTFFEDIPLEVAYKEASCHPDLAYKAECWMRRSLNRSYAIAMQGEHPIELPEEFAVDKDDKCPEHLSTRFGDVYGG